MLNALLIANTRSGTSHKLARTNLPGRWVFDPASVTADDVRSSDIIALFGGDGTLQKTLSQILREIPADELPPVAVLPFGTTNMSAKALNRTQGRQAAVVSLERAIRTSTYAEKANSLVQIRQGETVEHGFFWGAGVIAEVVERWNDERKAGAFTNQIHSLWAMISGLRTVNSNTPVRIDGVAHSVYGLLASTLDRLLFGSRPFWGEFSAGDLRLTWVEADAPDLFRHAPALLRGKAHMAAVPGYECRTVNAVELKFDGTYIIDGEIFHSSRESMTISRSDAIRWLVL